MSAPGISRGHPLIALLALVGGWVGGRVATWEAPLPPLIGAMPAQAAAPFAGAQSLPGSYIPVQAQGAAALAGASMPEIRIVPVLMPAGALPPRAFGRGGDEAGITTLPHLREEFAGAGSAFPPLPRFYAPEPPASAGAAMPPGSPAAPPRPRRWSMDAWALLRRDGAGALSSAGALPASYGASQAGGVLRYRLAVSDLRRPTLYLRSTATTGQLQETAAAAGFSARPVAALPVVAALEARITDQAGQRRVQGAAMAITELPPFPLIAGFRGESYVQAGYVAGRFATAFVDGQIRADRRLVRLGGIDLRLGGGVWGGAQNGAGRLDAGPAATIAVPLRRNLNARIALDWRFRLAGDAIPGSGPALTVSTGF